MHLSLPPEAYSVSTAPSHRSYYMWALRLSGAERGLQYTAHIEVASFSVPLFRCRAAVCWSQQKLPPVILSNYQLGFSATASQPPTRKQLNQTPQAGVHSSQISYLAA